MNLEVVKARKQKEDGTFSYGIYLLVPELNKYVRILTFKDDKSGYAVLETIAKYIGDVKLSDYMNKNEK